MGKKIKKASDTLLEARELLTTRGWTTGYLGRTAPDQYGSTRSVLDHNNSTQYATPLSVADRRRLRQAASFCLVGAVKAANGPGELDALDDLDVVVEGGRSQFGDLPARDDRPLAGREEPFIRVWKYNDALSSVDGALQALDAAYVLALQEEGLEPEDVL